MSGFRGATSGEPLGLVKRDTVSEHVLWCICVGKRVQLLSMERIVKLSDMFQHALHVWWSSFMKGKEWKPIFSKDNALLYFGLFDRKNNNRLYVHINSDDSLTQEIGFDSFLMFLRQLRHEFQSIRLESRPASMTIVEPTSQMSCLFPRREYVSYQFESYCFGNYRYIRTFKSDRNTVFVSVSDLGGGVLIELDTADFIGQLDAAISYLQDASVAA